MSEAAAALQVDLLSPEHLADPYPAYERLRREDPVHWHPTVGAWLVSRYADVVAALKDPRLSSSRAGMFLEFLPEGPERDALRPFVASLRQWLLFLDSPEHGRLRSLLNKAFQPRVIDALEPRVVQLVERLLDAAAARGRMDVVTDLADPLPTQVIAELLGVPAEDNERFKRWSDDLAVFFGRGRAHARQTAPAAVESWRALTECMREVVARRRVEPRDDFISLAIAAEQDGRVLSEDELLATCVLLLWAGHETTTHLLANGTLALLRERGAVQDMRDPALAPRAVEEMLRFDSPVQMFGRRATADLELGGKQVREGQLVMLMIGAANRDPDAFPAPDRFDPARAKNQHVAFGWGAHYCIGAHLARLEARVVFGALAARFPRLALDGAPRWERSMSFRALETLPVRLA